MSAKVLFGDCENGRCSVSYHPKRMCECDCHRHQPDEAVPVVDWPGIIARMKSMDSKPTQGTDEEGK